MKWIKLRQGTEWRELGSFTIDENESKRSLKVDYRYDIGELIIIDKEEDEVKQYAKIFRIKSDYCILYKEENGNKYYSAFNFEEHEFIDFIKEDLDLTNEQNIMINTRNPDYCSEKIMYKLISKQDNIFNNMFGYVDEIIELDDMDSRLINDRPQGYVKINNRLHVANMGFYSWGSRDDSQYHIRGYLEDELYSATVQLFCSQYCYRYGVNFTHQFISGMFELNQEVTNTFEAINRKYVPTDKIGFELRKIYNNVKIANIKPNDYKSLMTYNVNMYLIDGKYYFLYSGNAYQMTEQEVVTFFGCNYDILGEFKEVICKISKYYTFDQLLKGEDKNAQGQSSNS